MMTVSRRLLTLGCIVIGPVVFLISAGLFFVLKPTRAVLPQSYEAQWSISPLAEFEPIEWVMLSEYLVADNTGIEDLVRAILKAGAKIILLSDDMEPQQKNHSLAVRLDMTEKADELFTVLSVPHGSYWLRDFGPQIFRMGRKQSTSLTFVDFLYRESAQLDGTVPYVLGMHLSQSIQHIDFRLDGGNFLTNGEDCLLVDDASDVNQDAASPFAQRAQDLFQLALGCKKVHVVDAGAHEHIDMWAKFLTSNVLVINEIRQDLLEDASNRGEDIHYALGVKASLDKSASELSKYYEVHRLPMPLPSPTMFRTYLNAILVNGVAIIPRFEKNFLARQSYGDSKFLAKYEEEARILFEKFNFKTIFVNSDYLISSGGSFHCVTLGLPKL